MNNVADINFIRPLHTPILKQIGRVSTQGDGAMFTDAVRESFVLTRDEDGTPLTYVNGAGIKIGVISDSFDKQPASEGQSKATADVGNRDLPGTAGLGNPDYPTPVDVLKEYPYPGGSDEGRAMMHIIHDVAPGAELAFSTGILSPRDFALAIEDLALAGCDLIVDDVTYPFEPFFGEGQISKAIKDFTKLVDDEGEPLVDADGEPLNEGHAYFTSAGNFANKGYQSDFVNSTATPVTNPALPTGTKAHVFGGNQDVMQEIEVDTGTYFIVLQWDQEQASQDNGVGASIDLDFYILNNAGDILVDTNRVNLFGDGVETAVFQSFAENAPANIMITSANGNAPADLAFRYIIFRSDGLQIMEHFQGAPTVSGHAMTPEARTVGAVFYKNASNPFAEPFSSFAGLLENDQLTEIDISAPDGGNTNVESIGQDDINGVPVDGDGFKNFFGTSAAAPHAAAAFALLQSAIPTWYGEDGLDIDIPLITDPTNLIADQMLQLFKSSAIPAGPIETAGSGLINAEAALGQIAAQTAVITGFNIVLGEGEAPPTPGVDTYDVTISGNYIPAGANVLLGDQVLDIVGTPTTTEITATVGPFAGNPELTVLTNSDLPGAGKSNGLPIVPDGKIVLNITADPVDIEFGQDYEFTYSVEGLTGEMTYEDTGLPALVLTSSAVAPFPDVDDYTIFIDFVDGERTEAELAALDTYQVNFIEGDFIVTKKDLLIQPLDDTITYGDPVDVILGYTYVNDGISPENNAAFLEVIKDAHDMDFFVDNKLILINRFRAVVNEVDVLGLLNQGSWIGSDRTINNRFRAVVNGMDLIDLDISHFTDYDAAEEDPITNRFRAVVNRFRAVVNSTDLFGNQVDFDFGPEVPELNRFRAVVNGTDLGKPGDLNDYNKVFAVIDESDAPTEEDPDREISQFYALNLLSGLDVTPDTEGEEEDGRHYIFPGGFLNGLASNFNVTFGAGRLEVDAASLSVQTPDLEVEYGVGITRAYIDALISPVPVEEGCEVCPEASLFFEGFEYDDTVQTVFADPTCDPEELAEGEVCAIVIPYYFENIETGQTFDISEAGEEGLQLPLGSYFIKIENPQNYSIDFLDPIGELNIVKKSLTVNSEPLPIEYGTELTAASFTTVFDEEDFAPGEDETSVFIGGVITYYLVDAENEEVRFEITDRLPVGEYSIRIDDPLNYQIEYGLNHGGLTVQKKTLTVNTNELVIEYGTTLIGSDFSTSFVGFITGEDVDDVFPLPEGIPYYLLVDGDRIELDEARNVGSYEVIIDETETVPQNYTLVYGDDHEGLSITKKSLTVTTAPLDIVYGDDLTATSFNTNFDEFVQGDDENTVFNGTTPYYLVEEGSGTRFEIDDPLEVGVYAIKIDETESIPQNYSFADFNGKLTVVKKELILAFNDLVIDQGSTIDVSQFTFKSNPIGYVNGDDTASVFGTPLLFFEDSDGNLYELPGSSGVYFIRITAPKNYFITYALEGVVYVNPVGNNIRKVRTYLDCVEENPDDTDELIYIANYRYENPNDETIYVLNGEENRITGTGAFSGTLPTAFLPGQGTFQIRFNGNIKWELITLDSNNKTASTSDASATSNKCGSAGNSYSLVPNSVETNLNIYQNIPENSTVEIFSFYGVLYFTGQFTKNGPQTMVVNMEWYPTGFYVVRMTSKDNVKVYSIVKS